MTGPPKRSEGARRTDAPDETSQGWLADSKDTRTLDQVTAEAAQRRAAEEQRLQIQREWSAWIARQKRLRTGQHLRSDERDRWAS